MNAEVIIRVYLQETTPPVLTNVKVKDFSVKLQFLAEEVVVIGVDVVIEKTEEPGDAGGWDNDGGSGS